MLKDELLELMSKYFFNPLERDKKAIELITNASLSDINAIDRNGNSILHIALGTRNKLIHLGSNVCKLIISKINDKVLESCSKDYDERLNKLSCDVNAYHIPNGNGETVLHLAAKRGNLEIVKMLVEKIYKNLNGDRYLCFAKDNDGRTSLHYAVAHNHLEICKFLCEQCGTLKYHKDKEGDLPFYSAVLYRNKEICKYLLSKDPLLASRANKHNQTGLELAIMIGCAEIIEMCNTDEVRYKIQLERLKELEEKISDIKKMGLNIKV